MRVEGRGGRGWRFLAGLLVVAAVLVAGWAGSAAAAARGQIVVAQAGDASTLDPQMTAEVFSFNIMRHVVEGLVIRDEKLQIRPGLAESWRLLDPLTWQIKLRRGVKFHNGEDFNAEAVKFSIERIINPAQKSPSAGLLKSIVRVDIVDPYTVSIVTREPFPLLLTRMAFSGTGSMTMLPPRYVRERGDQNFALRPIGTGPFRFVEWVKDDHVTLEANPSYWRGEPKVKTLIFRPIPEAATRLAALESGGVDVVLNIPPDQVESIRRNPDLKIAESTSGGLTVMLHLNALKGGPMGDRRVRQALNYAVDADAIIRNLLRGHARRLAVPLDPNDFGANPNVKPYPYDPQRAKQLLAEAGYPNGLDLTYSSPNGRYMLDLPVAEAIAAHLGQVGVRVKVTAMEWVTYIKAVTSRQIGDMFMIGWGGVGLFDADVMMLPFHPSSPYHAIVIKPLADLLEKARTEIDPDKRKQLYWRAQEIIRDEAACLCLYETNGLFGLRKRVHWEPRIGEIIYLYDAEVRD